jgi:hypothetical protein
MTDLIKTEQELSRFFDRAEFVEKTFLQINKDLDLEQLALDWSEIDQSQDVLVQCISLLSPLLQNMSGSALQTFIYRVDLQENRFLTNLHEKNFDQLAFEIILREAQKVFLRMHFS